MQKIKNSAAEVFLKRYKEPLLFAGTFFLLYIIFHGTVAFWANTKNYSYDGELLLKNDFELMIQCLCLMAAAWGAGWLKILSVFEWPHWFSENKGVISSIFFGFLTASILVGLHGFLGFFKVQWPNWGYFETLLYAVEVLKSALLFSCWLVLLHLILNAFSRHFHHWRSKAKTLGFGLKLSINFTKMILLTFHSVLIYWLATGYFLQGEHRFVVGVFAVVLTLESWFWHERYFRALSVREKRKLMAPLFFRMGFWISLIFLYGVPFGSFHHLSFLSTTESVISLAPRLLDRLGILSLPLFWIYFIGYMACGIFGHLKNKRQSSILQKTVSMGTFDNEGRESPLVSTPPN